MPGLGTKEGTAFRQDLLINRPIPEPSLEGFFFFALDDNSGTLYQCDGEEWVPITGGLRRLVSGSGITLVNTPTTITINSTYTLPIASSSVLGGIKVGAGLAIDSGGVLSLSATLTLPSDIAYTDVANIFTVHQQIDTHLAGITGNLSFSILDHTTSASIYVTALGTGNFLEYHSPASVFIVDNASNIYMGGTFKQINNTALLDGQLLIGNTSGGRMDVATLTAGSGISITNGSGSITIANTAVTSEQILHGGTSVGTRPAINFIDGSNVTLTVADNTGSNRIDVTIASTGGGGGGGSGTVPSVSASYRSITTITIPTSTSGVAIPFDTTDYDQGTISPQHSTITNTSRLTCKVAGIYIITGGVEWFTPTSYQHELYIGVNGFPVRPGHSTNTYSAAGDPGDTEQLTGNFVSVQLKLAVNDYVELFAYQGSGSNQTIVHNTFLPPYLAWTQVDSAGGGGGGGGGPNFCLGQPMIYSNAGNLTASFVDGNTLTYRVSFTGTHNATDWFGVDLTPNPQTLSWVVYVHGHAFSDGGWFDASSEKPRIEVQLTSGGAWTLLGHITSYPATTSGSPTGLTYDGQSFFTAVTPTFVYGVRIFGTNGGSSQFSSCAEIQAF